MQAKAFVGSRGGGGGGGRGGTILYKTFPDFYIFHIKVIVPAKNIHPGPSKMK